MTPKGLKRRPCEGAPYSESASTARQRKPLHDASALDYRYPLLPVCRLKRYMISS